MKSTIKNQPASEIEWLRPLKGLGLIGIMIYHLTIEFGSLPWFIHPSTNWQDLASRLKNIFPNDYPSVFISILQFIGWLGANCTGVFVIASGIGLTWGALRRPADEVQFARFFKRRVVRIFPLYIAMHFVLLIGALLIPGNHLSLASHYSLLSLLGLRFTDSLFSYINPSWWFVCLILQLYILFPLLYKFLNRYGWKWFLIITFIFTVLSRLYGLLFSNSLTAWMMGAFFGTRLAEFASGMLIALYLKQRQEKKQNLPKVGQIFFSSMFIYIVGFLCSLFWYGTIVSKLLLSLGSAGIFLGIWQGLLSKKHVLATAMFWIGTETYGVFLFHQTPLQWTAEFFQNKMHLIAALLVLVLAFPAGWLLDRLVKKLQQLVQRLKPTRQLNLFSWFVILSIVFLLFFIEPNITSEFEYRIFAIVLGILLVFLGITEYVFFKKEKWLEQIIRWTVFFAGFLQLFIFSPHSEKFDLLVGVVIAITLMLVYRYANRDRLLDNLAY